MGLKGSVYVALFLSLNLLSLSMVTSQTCRAALSACLLNLVNVIVGLPPPISSSRCCNILQGLGARASACLCNSLRASILGINLNLPLTLAVNTTLNTCGLPNIGLRQCL
uniref:Bifunctional inhibitor/plant lipid transfer protein/seed storage helical domain-containing protein n=1 Tax=Phaseolus vulgaris TaxID=3885 RepID=V7AYZ9_PHAVU|nr:hypothetical protein PHAVU_009G217300g [Phaseolus vulgaris]ESW10530.1 hypothetical protein PHAVU_009G217300g [Phaseolus vulgaris]